MNVFDCMNCIQFLQAQLQPLETAILRISTCFGNLCKATKTIGFLRDNLALAPRHTKDVAYKTLVGPQLEYAAPIWHPYHDTQTARVEKVQRTAARWTVSLDKDKYLAPAPTLEVPGHLTNFSTPDTLLIVKP